MMYVYLVRIYLIAGYLLEWMLCCGSALERDRGLFRRGDF